MFFQVYGANALIQWGMLLVVLAGLILWNEFARRTKMGGAITFFVIPVLLTVYFAAIAIGARTGAEWAVNNQTHIYMNGWFHYAKLYAALTGCIGFMMIKYKWGIGAKHWFKPFPFVIVAINILIAVASDFESAAMGWNKWWLSSEGVWLYGGWHNVFNGLAGILNIFCMTAWWNVYASKDKKDMIWADMTWVYIVIYDIWNFAYTYNCLPTHSWYCGIALLLAPTVAALLWNRGGWIQNRANTLAIWCMFAQVVPMFQNHSKFTVLPSLYVDPGKFAATFGGKMNPDLVLTAADANPQAQAIIAVAAIVINVVIFCNIIKKAKAQNINPYKQEVFKGTRDFEEAMARAEKAA